MASCLRTRFGDYLYLSLAVEYPAETGELAAMEGQEATDEEVGMVSAHSLTAKVAHNQGGQVVMVGAEDVAAMGPMVGMAQMFSLLARENSPSTAHGG